MKSSNYSKENASNGGGGQQPHWKHWDPAATTVYVVHPAQFRSVVQQLTGTASSPPPLASAAHGRHRQGGGGGNGAGAAAAAGGANAAAQQRGRGEDGSSGGRTLGQMHQECMVWDDADDY